MAQQEGLGQPTGAGGSPGDDLGEFKVKRGGGVIIPIFFVILLLGVGGAALWYFTMREDPREVHNTFRREVYGPVHAKYYDAFWGCVLREPLRNFKNNQEVTNKIKSNGAGGTAKRYAEFIKTEENCLPLMDKAIPAFQVLKTDPATPPEYQELLGQLADHLERIRGAWVEYADFQFKADERAELHDRVDKAGLAWVGYQSSTKFRNPEKIAFWQPNAIPYVKYVQCILGDTSFTSFEGRGDEGAHKKALEHLEDQCFKNRAPFLDRVQVKCRDLLWADATPGDIEELERVTKHWAKNDWDFGTGIPIKECIQDYQKTQETALISNIAKAWYDFSKTYNEFIELNKNMTGDRFSP